MKKTSFAEAQTIKLSWPTPQDYNEALQHPATNFMDEELKVGKPELTKFGLPKAVTGNFASVYYMDCPAKDYAVRCFLHNISDQKDRYDAISKYLNQIALPIMADCDYFENGVLVHGNWYPVLRMDWVEGQNLIEYVGRNLDNAKVIGQLRQWLKDARKSLAEKGIAHGDLQHGNILVTNRGIKLVDYDGMYVPALAGFPSNELGHRNYQHPGRNKSHFGAYLDNFSAWLIDTSLFCLEKDPRLWFDMKGGDECLLFRQSDLVHPLSSPAFRRLENHKNAEIRDRAKHLRWLLTLPVEQVPDLDAPISVPADLPLLNEPSNKPDWISSAEYLQAEVVNERRVEPTYKPKAPEQTVLSTELDMKLTVWAFLLYLTLSVIVNPVFLLSWAGVVAATSFLLVRIGMFATLAVLFCLTLWIAVPSMDSLLKWLKTKNSTKSSDIDFGGYAGAAAEDKYGLFLLSACWVAYISYALRSGILVGNLGLGLICVLTLAVYWFIAHLWQLAQKAQKEKPRPIPKSGKSWHSSQATGQATGPQSSQPVPANPTQTSNRAASKRAYNSGISYYRMAQEHESNLRTSDAEMCYANAIDAFAQTGKLTQLQAKKVVEILVKIAQYYASQNNGNQVETCFHVADRVARGPGVKDPELVGWVAKQSKALRDP